MREADHLAPYRHFARLRVPTSRGRASMMFSEALRSLGVSLLQIRCSVSFTASELIIIGKSLVKAACYIEALERGIDEQRRARDVQVAMRVEAQQRAARLAKDARR
jgi:hypothetical protein